MCQLHEAIGRLRQQWTPQQMRARRSALIRDACLDNLVALIGALKGLADSGAPRSALKAELVECG